MRRLGSAGAQCISRDLAARTLGISMIIVLHVIVCLIMILCEMRFNQLFVELRENLKAVLKS
jgi:hypothetical protein